MSLASLARFLSIAQRHTTLLVDLAVEQDVLSRSRLLNYMEHHQVPAAEKDALIDALCNAHVLLQEAEQSYTLNPVVVDLINYYERRGRLVSAQFLKDQIVGIANQTDQLQQLLFAEQDNAQQILDRVDDLYRLVRQVREAGDSHYMACMRLFGDMKRTGEARTIERRIDELQTAQRRHITPLRELIDPGAEYAAKIGALRRRIAELGARSELLATSQELDSRRRRLLIDLEYIDHILLHSFGIIERTALTLLQSLLEEKSIKDALAACLGELETTWRALAGTTVVATGRQSLQAPPGDDLQAFFAAVVHGQLLPHPTPLSAPAVERLPVAQILVGEQQVWRSIREQGEIPSWPAFVVREFGGYSSLAQLRTIALPLATGHEHVRVAVDGARFQHRFDGFSIEMRDFGVSWEDGDGRIQSPQEPGNLSKVAARLPV